MKKILNVFIIALFTLSLLSISLVSWCEEKKEKQEKQDKQDFKDIAIEDQPSVTSFGFKYLYGDWNVDGWAHSAEKPQWGSYRLFGQFGIYKNLFAFYGSFETGEYHRDSISGTDNIRITDDPGTAGLGKVTYTGRSDDVRDDYHFGLSFNMYRFLERMGMGLKPWKEENKNQLKNMTLEFFVGYKFLAIRMDRGVDVDDINIAGYNNLTKYKFLQVALNRLPWSNETEIMEDGGGVLDADVKGFEFGIAGQSKRKKGCAIYYRFAYQPSLKASYHGNSNRTKIKHDVEADYYSIVKRQFNTVSGKLWGYQGEIGVNYNMQSLFAKLPYDSTKNINLIASLGYSFDEITGKDLWRNQTFHGITLGLVYAFRHNW